MIFKDFNGKLSNHSLYELVFLDDPTYKHTHQYHKDEKKNKKESIVTSYQSKGICLFVAEEDNDTKSGNRYDAYYSDTYANTGRRAFNFVGGVCETEEEVDKIIKELKNLHEQDTANTILKNHSLHMAKIWAKKEKSL